MWVGRGATARPWEAEWRSRVAAFSGGVITKMLSKVHLDIIASTTTEEHYVIRIKHSLEL